MPSRLYVDLIRAVQIAIASSGHTAVLMSSETEQPFRFALSGQGLSFVTLWVYIKSLTPAARSNPDEYRIQLRSADLPLALNPRGLTVLLGYYSSDNLFVGFDPHTISTGAMTQLSGGYVSLRVVKRSKRDGLSFDRDRRDRIAVGIRPDMLVPYALSAAEIHVKMNILICY